METSIAGPLKLITSVPISRNLVYVPLSPVVPTTSGLDGYWTGVMNFKALVPG